MMLPLDQGLPRTAAALLRAAGFDAVHTAEWDLATAEDAVILESARAEARTVITLDADFHALMARSGASSPSVIRVRREGLRADAMASLIQSVVTHCSDDLAAGALVSVESDRVRVRRLPIQARSPRQDR